MPLVGILGAGTMGSGIAQAAALAGWDVELIDVSEDFVRKSHENSRRTFEKLVEKGKLTPAARDAASARLKTATCADCLKDADLIIEAIVEDLAVKVNTLRPIVAVARPDSIFASNTSSLSITKIGAGIGCEARTVGMHFFNPVPLMPLVEVISGKHTSTAAADRVAAIATAWGKTVVRAADTPGFIVNRVARGYYLEALRMLDEGVAGIDEIDQTMRGLGAFRMGPFELMDLIGIDVNFSVSNSVWEQLGRPARLRPHAIQRDLFEKMQFGRKSKRGFYSYESEHPLPAVLVERQSFQLPDKTYQAVRMFFDAVTDKGGSITEQYIFSRIVATVINEAALLVDEGGATPADIDTAMKLGTNYPFGPLELAQKIGRRTCAFLLRSLDEGLAQSRFAPARWLTD
ncbi:MAG: hypothetical protein JNG88_09615 [Phycisphaerales bacterium]|nr:hypothetical protein [Phycisphaerales bacterium]